MKVTIDGYANRWTIGGAFVGVEPHTRMLLDPHTGDQSSSGINKGEIAATAWGILDHKLNEIKG